MRPGPDFSTLSDISVGYRVSVSRGSRVLAVDVPAAAVSLQVAGRKRVPEQLTFRAPAAWIPDDPLDPLNVYGQRTHLTSLATIDGIEHEIDMGWYLHTKWEEQGSGDVLVTAYGLARTLDEDEWAWPTSPAKGSTLRQEAQRICGNHLPVILDPGVADSVLPVGLAWGRSRSQALMDLCGSLGLAHGVRADGYMHLWVPGQSRDVVATYRLRDTLLTAPRSEERTRPNRVTVAATVKREKGLKTDVEVDVTEGSRAGWTADEVAATFSYPSDRMRCTWKAASGASQTGFGLTLKKAMLKSGTGTATVTVRASRSMTLRYGLLNGTAINQAYAATTTINVTFKTLTLTLPNDHAAAGLRLYVDDTVQDGDWIEVSSVTLTNWTSKGGTKTILSQDFSDHKRPGWTAIVAKLAWTSPEDGRTGDHMRAALSGLAEDGRGNYRLKYRKKIDADGDKAIKLWVSSTTSAPVVVKALNGASVIDEASVTAQRTWTAVALAVPSGTPLTGINITTGGGSPTHWVGVDDFTISRTYMELVDQDASATAANTSAPFDADYGVVRQVTELSSAERQVDVINAANRGLSDAAMAAEVRSLEIAVDPRIEEGDVIGVVTETEMIVGRVTNYALAAADEAMRVDVEVLTW